MKVLKLISSIFVIILFTGCSTTSIFDPAPYNPSQDDAVLSSLTPKCTPINILQFSSLEDAANKLQAISLGYEAQRDSLMRQQLLFDIPMMGLAAGTIASGIYGGSKGLTLGLGLGSSAMAGGRLYFGPQTKVSAYTTAALSLNCTSFFARELKFIEDTNQGQSTLSSLSASILLANNAIISGIYNASPLSAKVSTDLLVARDQAKKAHDDLLNSLALLASAPSNLSTFASTIINDASKKIVNGTQNINAVLALINASPTTATSTTPAPAPGRLAVGVPPARPATVADLITTLQDLSATAALVNKAIKDKWTNLSQCAASAIMP